MLVLLCFLLPLTFLVRAQCEIFCNLLRKLIYIYELKHSRLFVGIQEMSGRLF
jgi:hypothetical protein